MSDEKKQKTPAELEQELLAAREKEVAEQPQTEEPEQPQTEEPEQPQTEEPEQPQTEEPEQPQTEEPEQPQTAEAEQPQTVATEKAPQPKVAQEAPQTHKPAEKTAAQLEKEIHASRFSKAEPEPDNDEQATADPEAPLTAAQREAALLKQRQTASQAEQKEEEQEKKGLSRRLGIHNLNKTLKGKLILLGVFLICILIFCIWNFPDTFRAMWGHKEAPATTDENSQGAGKSQRLTDLGKGKAFDTDTSDTAGSGQSKGGDKGGSSKDNGAGSTGATPPPVTFSRALAQGISSSNGSTQGSSNAAGRDEREPEADSANESGVEPAADNAAHKKGLTAIKVLPYDPNLFVPENTAIPCSLDRRFVSDLSGKMTCTINDDIYSANGNVKLIEKGTRATLVYKTGVLRQGMARAFLIATKLRTRKQPFMDIPLVDSEAAGALGESGVDGWIDTHFWERFGGAMMLGMIPDAMQGLSGAAKSNKDNQSDYTSNSREAFAEIAKEAFANSVNIPPTMYKNQGEIITLITGQDLDFSGVYRLKMKH